MTAPGGGSPRNRALALARSTPGSGGPGVAPARDPETEALERLLLAFAPMHKAAFGAAIGIASGLLMALVTLWVLLTERGSGFPLYLMGQFFYGFGVSWSGAVIGALWAAFVGFVAGWFFAFCRNLVVAIFMFMIRSRAELAETRDFLDHI